jgi:hypothetical protein
MTKRLDSRVVAQSKGKVQREIGRSSGNPGKPAQLAQTLFTKLTRFVFILMYSSSLHKNRLQHFDSPFFFPMFVSSPEEESASDSVSFLAVLPALLGRAALVSAAAAGTTAAETKGVSISSKMPTGGNANAIFYVPSPP